MTWTVSEEDWSGACRVPLIGIHLVFSRLGAVGVRRKSTEPFSSPGAEGPSCWCGSLAHRGRCCPPISWLSSCPSGFPTERWSRFSVSHTMLSEGSHCAQPTHKGIGVGGGTGYASPPEDREVMRIAWSLSALQDRPLPPVHL